MIKGHTKKIKLDSRYNRSHFFWGVGGTVSQKLFQDYSIHVNWLVTVRLLIAGILLLTVQCVRKGYFHIISIWRNKKNCCTDDHFWITWHAGGSIHLYGFH